MKLRILTVIIVAITTIFTVKIFLNLQKRWSNAEIFQDVIINAPLFVRHLLISPEQLGIDTWYVGDYAAYRLNTNVESKKISFYVAARDTGESKHYWLRSEGLSQFNEVQLELWRLLNETSLHLGSEVNGFFFADDPFLLPLNPVMFPSVPVLLEDRGSEVLTTPVGDFKCQHYFASSRSPSGKLEPLLELWANSSVRPLGIVRARWRDETLDLVDVKPSLPIELPKVLSATLSKKPLQKRGCIQCHHEGMGGRYLTFPSKYRLSGVEVNLTECLFHYYQAGLIQTSDPIRLQVFSRSKRIASRELVRLTWAKGSLWVKANPLGQLTFSLDALASQEDLRATPRRGSLVLNLEK